MLSADAKPSGSSGKKETLYSDRFVPSRTASAGLREFSLLDAAVPPVSAAHPSSEREVRHLRNLSARAPPRLPPQSPRDEPLEAGSPRTDAPDRASRPPVTSGSEPWRTTRFFVFFPKRLRRRCETRRDETAESPGRAAPPPSVARADDPLSTRSARPAPRKHPRTRPRRTPRCSAPSFWARRARPPRACPRSKPLPARSARLARRTASPGRASAGIRTARRRRAICSGSSRTRRRWPRCASRRSRHTPSAPWARTGRSGRAPAATRGARRAKSRARPSRCWTRRRCRTTST